MKIPLYLSTYRVMMLLVLTVVCLVKLIRADSITLYEIVIEEQKFEAKLPSGMFCDLSFVSK